MDLLKVKGKSPINKAKNIIEKYTTNKYNLKSYHFKKFVEKIMKLKSNLKQESKNIKCIKE